MNKHDKVKKVKLREKFETQIIIIILLTAVITACSVFGLMSNQNKRNLMQLLTTRAEIVLAYIEPFTTAESFSRFNTPQDVDDPLYQTIQGQFDHIRQVARLKYLYTIKQNEAGEFVYHIHGQQRDAPDFCYPGQAVEKQLSSKVETAFTGKQVLAEWIEGNLVFSPFYDAQGAIIGVVGIEYDVNTIHFLDKSGFIYSIMAVLSIIVLLSAVFSVVFKGIVRPFHKKLAYTDGLTGLNNRTAFELDKKRLEKNLKNYLPLSMLMFDLNTLKEVNDTLGHIKGDLYITTAAEWINTFFTPLGTCYRIGGDEFCVIITGVAPEKVKTLLEQDFAEMVDQNRWLIRDEQKGYFAIAYGMAVFDPGCHKNLHELFMLADERMYATKRRMKAAAPNGTSQDITNETVVKES
ncbi:MAG: GGDEF domain-containing protein [Treponema sp.]|nr:GGDEF domain-containing protein [Treponema sp.]